MNPLRFVVIGLGGYGLVHIDAVKWLATLGLGKLTGVVALPVDRTQRPEAASALEKEGVVLYDSVEQFLAGGAATADVLTVPIGIHAHVPVSIAAMRAGLHVYCEKPLAATLPEVDSLIAVKRETKRTVAVGFQHIFSNSMQQMKTRICDGRLGRVKSVTLMCGWPRSAQYYSRNEWTGKLRIGKNIILDSPANNAHAHYVMNVLYLASSVRGEAAVPVELEAELYRANRIESPDTVQLRFVTDGGAHAFIVLTHANGKPNGPLMSLECEKGRVAWVSDNGATTVTYADGREETFDNLLHDKWRYEGFRDFVTAVREGRDSLCPPELARAQTLTINAMHESAPDIVTVPDAEIDDVEDWEMFPPDTRGNFRRIHHLDDLMGEAVEKRKMFSELGVSWGRKGAKKWVAV
jgi:predicted dehydrogenase